MGSKKFAVLHCADDSDYVKKLYGGYFGIFVRMLGEEGETWDVYKVAKEEFPEDNEIGEYDGFVITGSCSDAHGNELWISKLVALLKKLDAMKKKVLGICFGHQIMGRALGGKTGRATSGWDIGVTQVHLQPSKIFNSLKMSASLSVIECHQDEVWELPPNVEIMAQSNKTRIEMFKYGDHIMGIQGHPEYTKDILLNIIDRLLNHNLIEESLAEEAKSKLETSEPDSEAWKKLCTSFLKGKL
ncbi:gamma-glutamyl peptidase 5-like [Olea europaea subsp. europaea]|uniref:Gamma-glutamyl peptidase 5-like n=1 Tax=Olea europaea subsp. europaea TaxID=158383 RepID=A0A8S0TBK4_OLEEU|nr:gamma-glutamyl peptidase 5-like [Olea europaea subsp. europaea]